jgi:hypothetical protein
LRLRNAGAGIDDGDSFRFQWGLPRHANGKVAIVH